MRSAFGKVNTLHTHVLPWTDRPLVTENLLGGEEGLTDAGISVARLIPNPWMFLEATGQVFRGDSGDVFQSSERGDLSYVGHLRGYQDITESSNIDLGFSYARGHNASGLEDDVLADRPVHDRSYGVDATFRWKPLQRSIYRRSSAAASWSGAAANSRMACRRRSASMSPATISSRAAGSPARATTARTRAEDASLRDTGESLLLTYKPTEFSLDARPVPAHATSRSARPPTSSCSSSCLPSARTARTRSEESHHAHTRLRLRSPRSACSSRPRRRAQGKLNVITTTEDLASIAREVGGDRITVDSLARGYQDPHFVEAKPSFILKLQKADLLIVVGRELEIGWLPPLIQQSRNAKIQAGADGVSRRVGARAHPRHPAGADHAGDGGRPSERQPALLARSRERQDHRARHRRQAGAVSPCRQGVLRSAPRRFHQPSQRRREALAGGDGAVQGRQGRHLSPLVSQLRRPLRPRRHRLRRAAAGHSAVAGSHARFDPGDEAAAASR